MPAPTILLSTILAVACGLGTAATSTSDTMGDIVRLQSRLSFDRTLQRLRSKLDAKGYTVFAWIDQRAAALSVGLEMQPTVAVIYGNPRGGTQLMVAAPDFAIELPLKVVVREESDGTVIVLYKSAKSLEGRHGLPKGLTTGLAASEALIADAAGLDSGDVPQSSDDGTGGTVR